MEKEQVGFTLLEILLILFLIMVLVSMAAPRFSSAVGFTRARGDEANRVLIEGAVELYRLDTGMLPQKLEDLYFPPSGVTDWRGPYLDQQMVKPSGDGVAYELDERGKIIP